MLLDKTLYLNIFSLIILILMYINVHNHTEKMSLHYKIFIYIIFVNMCLIPIDLLSWAFNSQPGLLNMVLNSTLNLLSYIFDSIAAALWVLFADWQIFHDEIRIKKTKHILAVLLIINGAVSVVSLYTGWFFKIDSNNVYTRGTYFWYHIAFCYSLLVYSSLFIFKNRDKINKRHFISMLLFPIPQAIGGILQASFYGLSLSWSAMTLSVLMIYFSIQDRGLSTDYLTGVYNRRRLDYYIKDKIRSISRGKSFSAILIDIDNFKEINDVYGHDAGDEALQVTARLLKKSLRDNDFIARFGGDEFYIILDVGDASMLKSVVDRINQHVKEYNANSSKPYKISFSMGYDVYDNKSAPNFEDFCRHIDLLMYNDKSKRHL